jgi:hypothetical protein
MFRVDEDENEGSRFLQNVGTALGSGATVTVIREFHASTTLKYPIVKSLCVIKHYTLKAHREREVKLHRILNVALDSAEWSASCPTNSPFKKHPAG